MAIGFRFMAFRLHKFRLERLVRFYDHSLIDDSDNTDEHYDERTGYLLSYL